MKALIWKEWRENRLIVVWAVALMLVFLVGDVAFEISARTPRLYADELQEMIIFVWAIAALLCGSSTISPEIGSGSLQFLGVLPLSRGRIWWTKLATGLCILAASLVAAWITLNIFCWFAAAIHLVEPARNSPMALDLLAGFAGAIPLFAVGSLVSTLVDRTISALMASIVAAVVLGAAITGLVSLGQSLFQWQNGNVSSYVLIALVALTVPALLVMSYAVFTGGETLRTPKRFKILMGFMLPPVSIVISCFVAWFIVMS